MSGRTGHPKAGTRTHGLRSLRVLVCAAAITIAGTAAHAQAPDAGTSDAPVNTDASSTPDENGVPDQLTAGKLRRPILAGKVARWFGATPGQYPGTTVRHTGWTFESVKPVRVSAVASGTVMYAGPRRGSGLLVVLDHGHGYHSVYATLESVQVEVGQAVERGDAVGRMGTQFYFEWRHHARPLDPIGWFAPPQHEAKEE